MVEEKTTHTALSPIDPTIRVLIPAEVSFDLEKMKKVTAAVLGRLGCGGCHSGYDISFIHEREFVVNAKTLAVEARIGPQAQ